MAFTTLGTVAPGDVLRANSGTAAYNNVIGNVRNAPRGLVGTPAISSFTSGVAVTTSVADSGLSISVPMIAGRNYLMIASGELSSGGANVTVTLFVTDGSNTQLTLQATNIPNAGVRQLASVRYIETAAATGTVTRKIRASASTNSTLAAAADRPWQFYVMDLGA